MRVKPVKAVKTPKKRKKMTEKRKKMVKMELKDEEINENPSIKMIYGKKNRVKLVIYDLMEPVTTKRLKNRKLLTKK